MSTTALELEAAYAQCVELTRRTAANFYYGIRLLPRERRDAMSAVYAFAREIDDLGDEHGERELKLAQLAAARAKLAAIATEESDNGYRPQAATIVALRDAHARFRLPLDAFELLIDAVSGDVRGVRYATFDELVGYCRGVAGSIGRLCLAIFSGGGYDARQERLADDLGVAMQLTNVLRDVREDAENGRVYLPAQDLARFGCEPPAPPSAELIQFQAARARAWFERSLELVRTLDRPSAACVLAMSGIYAAILRRIEHDPEQVLRERISLPTWDKAWIATRSVAGGLGPRRHGPRRRVYA